MSENIHWGRGSSCWQPSRHWLHRGLSFWHRPVRPGREGFVAVVTLWSQVPGFSVHFVFSVYYEYHWDDWNIVENCVKMLPWSHVFVVLRKKIKNSWYVRGFWRKAILTPSHKKMRCNYSKLMLHRQSSMYIVHSYVQPLQQYVCIAARII